MSKWVVFKSKTSHPLLQGTNFVRGIIGKMKQYLSFKGSFVICLANLFWTGANVSVKGYVWCVKQISVYVIIFVSQSITHLPKPNPFSQTLTHVPKP